MRSPSFTGKTSHGQLVSQQLELSQTKYLFINCLEMSDTETFEDFFLRKTNYEWETLVRMDEEIFVITDSSQKMVENEQKYWSFWKIIKLLCQQIVTKLRIIIFTTFAQAITLE